MWTLTAMVALGGGTAWKGRVGVWLGGSDDGWQVLCIPSQICRGSAWCVTVRGMILDADEASAACADLYKTVPLVPLATVAPANFLGVLAAT